MPNAHASHHTQRKNIAASRSSHARSRNNHHIKSGRARENIPLALGQFEHLSATVAGRTSHPRRQHARTHTTHSCTYIEIMAHQKCIFGIFLLKSPCAAADFCFARCCCCCCERCHTAIISDVSARACALAGQKGQRHICVFYTINGWGERSLVAVVRWRLGWPVNGDTGTGLWRGVGRYALHTRLFSARETIPIL